MSVVMPVYNAERFLAEAVTSILEQTYADFEFVCVNDGSTDGSLDLLQGFAAEDPRIRILSQPNGGIVSALNAGIDAAAGDLIARMDADDRSFPNRLAAQHQVFVEAPSVVLVSCDFEVIDDDGNPLSVHETASDEASLPLRLFFYNAVGGHSQVMCRRTALDDAGGYISSEELAEDYGLWCRMARLGTFRVVPEVLHQYRINPDGLSRRNTLTQQAQALEVARRHLADYLDLDVSLEDIEIGRRFWTANGKRRGATVGSMELPALDRVLRDVLEAY